jgi:WXXGXW repeat (2 copies)
VVEAQSRFDRNCEPTRLPSARRQIQHLAQHLREVDVVWCIPALPRIDGRQFAVDNRIKAQVRRKSSPPTDRVPPVADGKVTMSESRRRGGANILIEWRHIGRPGAVTPSDADRMPRHWRQAMMKRTLYALAAVAIATPALIAPAIFTPAAAQASVSLNIGVPLPAPYVEVVPAPRPDYLWEAGYWRWDHDRRFWERGHWREDRRFGEHRYDERHGWNEHGWYR